MKKLINSICAITLLLAGVTAASAQGYYGRSYYMRAELVRIQQGLRTGELTPHEAARLRTKIANLQSFEQSARADGYLDWRERTTIEREKAEISRSIWNKKHNWRNQDNTYNPYGNYDRWNR
jgi:hypothetical protein